MSTLSQASRREFLQTTVAAGAVILAGRRSGAVTSPAASQRRPNLILLLTDDQRADLLGCAGHPILKTPRIDSLAGKGVRFTNAFATSSICVTSRASILTGLFPPSHGVENFVTPLKPSLWETSYPMLLKKAGYRTGFVGKWGLDGGPLPVADYDSFVGYSGQGRYFEPGSSTHLTARQSEQAVTFLQSCKADQPFCLQVSFKAPHVEDEGRYEPGIYAKYPYDPAYHWQYMGAQTRPTATVDRTAQPQYLARGMNRTREGPDFDSVTYQQTLQHLYRLHAGIDDAVGAVIDCLNQMKLASNTIIIYASDHGSFYGEHGFGGKWLMHEEAIRSPLIVFDPRLPVARQGSTCESSALNIDLPATLLDLAGLGVPAGMQGKSLLPLVLGQNPTWRQDWFFQQSFANAPTEPIAPSEGVRTDNWKYILYPHEQGSNQQLFDLQHDPREENDLASDVGSQPMLQRMRARFKNWKALLPAPT